MALKVDKTAHKTRCIWNTIGKLDSLRIGVYVIEHPQEIPKQGHIKYLKIISSPPIDLR